MDYFQMMDKILAEYPDDLLNTSQCSEITHRLTEGRRNAYGVPTSAIRGYIHRRQGRLKLPAQRNPQGGSRALWFVAKSDFRAWLIKINYGGLFAKK